MKMRDEAIGNRMGDDGAEPFQTFVIWKLEVKGVAVCLEFKERPLISDSCGYGFRVAGLEWGYLLIDRKEKRKDGHGWERGVHGVRRLKPVFDNV